MWFPKAQRLESCFQVGSLFPVAPLCLCNLHPLPTLALSPVAEVYRLLPLPGEGARKRWFLFLTQLREEGDCVETGPPQPGHPHQVRGQGMRGTLVGGPCREGQQ